MTEVVRYNHKLQNDLIVMANEHRENINHLNNENQLLRSDVAILKGQVDTLVAHFSAIHQSQGV